MPTNWWSIRHDDLEQVTENCRRWAGEAHAEVMAREQPEKYLEGPAKLKRPFTKGHAVITPADDKDLRGRPTHLQALASRVPEALQRAHLHAFNIAAGQSMFDPLTPHDLESFANTVDEDGNPLKPWEPHDE